MWSVFALVVIFSTIRNIYDSAWWQDEAMAVTTDVGTQVLEDTNTLFITFSVSHFWRLDMCFNGILPVMPLTIGALSGTLMVFISLC